MDIPSRKTLILAVKYALVGASSTIIDVGVLTLLVEFGHLHLLVAAIISFCVAVGNGFFWNKRWTFQNTSSHLTRQYIKFFLTSLVGLILNLLLLSFFVYFLHFWYVIAKMITTGLVFFWNFTVNKFWTFRSYTIERPRSSTKPSCEISVLIPAYNEEHDLRAVVEKVAHYLIASFETWEIICIDDGSTDTTAAIVQKLAQSDSHIRPIIHAKNLGKGASVRDGVHVAQGALILFMDADGSTPITQLDTFMPFFSQGADIIIGSRYLKESSIVRKQPWYRIALGRIGNLFIQALLLDVIKDTQCGFKAFTFNTAQALFERSTIDGWGFDMEILALAQHMGYDIKEVPVQWHDSETRKSRFRPFKDAHRTFRELLRIKWNLITSVYTLTKEKKSVE